MQARANTTVSVLRGASQDEFGDEEDTGTVSSSGIKASILERTRTVFSPDTNEPQIVRTVIARIPASIDIENGDRILDEGSGTIYIVTDFSTSNTIGGFALDRRLDLRRIT